MRGELTHGGVSDRGAAAATPCRSRLVTACFVLASLGLTLMQLMWGAMLVRRHLARRAPSRARAEEAQAEVRGQRALVPQTGAPHRALVPRESGGRRSGRRSGRQSGRRHGKSPSPARQATTTPGKALDTALDTKAPRGTQHGTFCGVAVPTRAERVAELHHLEGTRPFLVRVYRLSCLSYSLTGVFYYCTLDRLPAELRATFLMGGEAFCACLLP